MMFKSFTGSFGHDLHLLLSWWAVLGFFAASFMPPTNGCKRRAKKQWIILGPLFWVGVPLFGLFICAKNKRKVKA